MCTYCIRVQSAILRSGSIGFWMTRCRLKINPYGDIKYTKWSGRTSKPYSKTIPLVSLCQAKNLAITQGPTAVNRTWHNSLPEGINRPCNLKVIESILVTFP